MKDRKQSVIPLSLKDCMVLRNEATWVSHIMSAHKIRSKFMVQKSFLNANNSARTSTLLNNHIGSFSLD